MAEILFIAQAMIAAYNAQNADAYVAFMTDDAAEASYRGNVLRDGKEGVRAALIALFAEYPDNSVQVLSTKVFGETVVFEERVTRGARLSGDIDEHPFDVLAIYSFEGDKCSRVEFIR